MHSVKILTPIPPACIAHSVYWGIHLFYLKIKATAWALSWTCTGMSGQGSLLMCPSRQHCWQLSGRCATLCLFCPLPLISSSVTHSLPSHLFFFFKLPVCTRQGEHTGGSWWSSNPISFPWAPQRQWKHLEEYSQVTDVPPLSVDHGLVGADTADLPFLGLRDCSSGTGVILVSVHGLLLHHLYFPLLFLP